MWNERLFKALLCNIADFEKKKTKHLAREIAFRYDLSPSTLDVTFELGANKCIRKACFSCPFGDNQLCHKGKQEICSVSKWLFPYTEKQNDGIRCNPCNCAIAKDIGKNLCTREIEKKITH